MKTTTESRDLYDANGQGVWTYCEKCYDAPQWITAELVTTSAQGIDPAVSVRAFVVTCSGCNGTQRFEAV